MSGDTPSRGRWRWVALPVAALAVWAVVRGGSDTGSAAPPSSPTPHASATPSKPPSQHPSPSPSPSEGLSGPYDPADYATQVRHRAQQAGVSPQLVMAVLYNESYKPHDPDLERAWQRYKPDAAFGIGNMHRATFDLTKRGRDFAGRRWDELPDDRDLAIESTAWYLHDLGAQLPSHWTGPHTRDELLALGYNTGAGNMLAFARGTHPGTQAQSYLTRLHDNWEKAGKAVAARP
ncbi:lytic transglycosylase domain-containing protein [Streptomyces sp. NPDC058001]|uniref:lytic transglycosylase domain-containing protein n=1 Tax=Streptomyces sp. NPDC058001 TaxID=3346300 RepID=UPI0036ED3612